jgi:hypothetical protein
VDQPDPLRGLDVEGLVAVGLQDSGGEAGSDGGSETGVRVVDRYDAVSAERLGKDACAGV